MSLTVTEANAVNRLLDFIAQPDASDATAEKAAGAAGLLADHAHKTLMAGRTATDAGEVVADEQARRDRHHAALEVCVALAEHQAHGGAIPWPSIERPFYRWLELHP